MPLFGLADTPPAHETATNDMLFGDGDDDEYMVEEIMATGVLPTCTRSLPISGYISHSQESPSLHTEHTEHTNQDQRALHSSPLPVRRLSFNDVYVEVTPADDIFGSDWRNIRFPHYRPDGISSVDDNRRPEANSIVDGCGSDDGDSKTLLLELRRRQQQQRQQQRLQQQEWQSANEPRLLLASSQEAVDQSPPRQLPPQNGEQSSPRQPSPHCSPQALKPSRLHNLQHSAPQSPSPPPQHLEEPPQSPPPFLQPPQSPHLAQSPRSRQPSMLSPASSQSPTFQVLPDYDGLKDIDRSYTEHRLTYVELLMQAWAHGHCQSGNSFASEEITLMSQLARQSHNGLGRSLRNTYGMCLQRCTDITTADTRAQRWRIVNADESGSAAESQHATASNFDMLSRMVATMAQYAAMLPSAANPHTTAHVPAESRPSKRVAADRLIDYREKRLGDFSYDATPIPRPKGTSRRRSTATPRNRALHAKLRPLTDTKQGANADSSTSNDLLAKLLSPSETTEPSASLDVQPTMSKRVKRATAEEKESNKSKRAAAATMLVRYQAAGLTIQDLLANERAVVRVTSPNNCPSVAELTATPFVPIVFMAHSEEPAHYILNCRTIAGAKTPSQTQGFHEYAINGFPVPVVPDRWLEYQRRKFRRWCRDEAGCKVVQLANEVDNTSCMCSPIHGPSMCRGCVTRQSDCPCRFRYIRVMTRLDVLAAGGSSKLRRYIVAPMFASQVDGAATSLAVKPTSISIAVGDLASSSAIPAGWSEFYSLFMTAPTLLRALDVIGPITFEHAVDMPAGSLEYGVLPEYGCSAAPCIYRTISPGSRQVCDLCSTSVMSVCFSCCMCATEMCVGCFSEWDDGSAEPRVAVGSSYNKAHSGSRSDDGGVSTRRYNHCKKFNGTSELSLHLQAQHRKRQFIRVSQFTAADIRQVVEKARGVVDLGSIYPELSQISSAGVISDTAAQAFTAKVARIEQRTRDMYPHAAWELPVIYVAADELSTAEFSCLWRQGIVVVVRGLLSALNGALWQPEWWIKNFGDEKVSILDCARKAEPVGGGEWPLRNFYRLFDGSDKYAALFDTPDDASSSEYQLHSDKEGDNNGDRGRADRAAREWREHKACVARGILKLKDWPPTDDFERRLPRHFRHFMKALPFPEYTQRAGKFNLANRLPAAFVPPDLGPKMYCAYGSSDGEGGVGTTNLHCDMADAVNIMAYAPAEFLRERNIEVPGIWTRSDGSPHMSAASKSPTTAAPAAAVWDIYPPEALGNLREFIGQVHDIPFGAECKGPIAAKHGDPIHNQETYLSLPLRQKFFDEYGH
ncbi:hypothetical protein GGF42_005260, partial [Coemansia sp. RSA 2424]